jgi:homocysteine S-methyltransferase
MLESATWRANPDWGNTLGYCAQALARVNRQAIIRLRGLRQRYAPAVRKVVVSGMVGPRGDGYQPEVGMNPDDAAAYHRPQLAAFADGEADMATAYTLSDVGEAIGIVRAAREVDLPVPISFTVETDGRLPDGRTLEAAIAEVENAGGPEYFLVNCAHPIHIALALQRPGEWRERIIGVRPNASTLSHAELDEATELDDGDPVALAAAHAELSALLPNLSIVGGCCGTDARHVAQLWQVDPPDLNLNPPRSVRSVV